jgi:hypothetical protein
MPAPGVSFLLAAQSAFSSWSIEAKVFTVIALLAAIAFLNLLAKKLFTARPDSPERKEALRLGITVKDVERDLPEFTRGNRSCRLVRGTCVQYSLPRAPQNSPTAWSILQRTIADGAQLPNGYLLRGDVSEPLRQTLSSLAMEFSEDLYEFEGTSDDVSLFWEEYGGAPHVRHLHGVLKKLATM